MGKKYENARKLVDAEKRYSLEEACNLLPQLELTALISHRFPVEHAAEAFALVDQHPEQTVQVLLTYGHA